MTVQIEVTPSGTVEVDVALPVIDINVAQVTVEVIATGPPGPGGGGSGGSGGVVVDASAPSSGGFDVIWVDVDGVDTGGGGGGSGVTDHGALTGLSDPDHPIAAVQGLQAALDAKANTSHSHVLGDLPLALATDAEVTTAISTHAATPGHEVLSTTMPAALGTTAVGNGTTTARSNHVHQMPNLNDLTDVSTSGANNGQSLVYNSGNWGPATVTSGGGVTDHAALTGRSTADSHPISAITNLTTTLNGFALTDHTHVFPQAFSSEVGAGTVVPVVHNLGTSDVTVQVMRNTSPWDTVVCDVGRPNDNSVTLSFVTPVAAGAFWVIVHSVASSAAPPVGQSVLDFGAVGNGVVDDQTAIQNALNTMPAGGTLLFPSGYTFNHSGVLRVMKAGVTLAGGGTINATNENLSSVWVRDVDDVTIMNLNITNTASTQRHAEWEQVGLLLMDCDGCHVSYVHITESGSAGLQIENASNFTIDHVLCEDTWSDSIHMTGGSNNGSVTDVEVRRPGDDGVANVSYGTSPANHHITVERAVVTDQVWGRSFSVVGGHDITYRDCSSTRSACATIYIACEPSYSTLGVSNILFEDIEIVEANTRASLVPPDRVDHGAVLIYNGRDGYTITDVTLRDIRVTDTNSGASRQMAFISDVAGCIITRVSLETVTVTRGPGTTLYENIPDTNYRYTGVVVDGSSIPNFLGWS